MVLQQFKHVTSRHNTLIYFQGNVFHYKSRKSVYWNGEGEEENILQHEQYKVK
jgi:hypothetical protein